MLSPAELVCTMRTVSASSATEPAPNPTAPPTRTRMARAFMTGYFTRTPRVRYKRAHDDPRISRRVPDDRLARAGANARTTCPGRRRARFRVFQGSSGADLSSQAAEPGAMLRVPLARDAVPPAGARARRLVVDGRRVAEEFRRRAPARERGQSFDDAA